MKRFTHPRALRFCALGALGFAALAAGVSGQVTDPLAWRAGAPDQPAAVLVRNATIWTSGPDGILEGADLLIESGRISRVGTGLSAPSGAVVVDAAGRHVTAGLIDAHSHVAIDGGVNEGSNITTSEVRIADVLDPSDRSIYQQLAGGLTVANVLHGSANSIGGQNAVIKLRWGADAEGLKFDGAPEGIKFALGENPKQSNWGGADQLRYPQSRSGVEQSIRERFLAAQDYRQSWEEFESADDGRIPPRRDLQLEAIVEILEGKRLVHSHSYRADEILMLLRLMEQFGVRVSSLQHVLEGYKVADEIAAHGAGASTFSDWWAYKYEVRDAIPWNGAIMHDRGVVVSFNSDDSELARRLNLEAAKAVRYGGLEPAEALNFVTLNPAIQLGIDDRVGSLEPGKDADFVLWSGNPLSTSSFVEQSWIDGRQYFDRAADQQAQLSYEAERLALIEKIRAEESADEEEAEEGEETDEATDTDPDPDPDPGLAVLFGGGKAVQR